MDGITPPFGLRKRDFDGRLEKRTPMIVPVHLTSTTEPRSADKAATRNVSPHGVRLVSKRLWHPGDEPFLIMAGEFPQLAQIVYCQPRPSGGFYVGLRFHGRSVRWENFLAKPD
jgi:hypothetical protein